MENFSIFLLSGILPWNFFTTSLSQSTTVILENANLVKKIYFPREIFPLASVLANLVNLSLSFIPLFLLFSLLKMKLGLSIVILPVVIAIQLLFTLGLTLIIAPATVLFRDITHILEVVLLGWFFLSPIIYPKEFLIATPPLSTILRCNPMLYIIDNYHYVIYSSSFPPLESILISFISAFLSLIIGKITFKKLERRVVKKL
jgi:ABC-2 type transport system permease protein